MDKHKHYINTKIYIQVTENMSNPSTRERELAAFYKIKESHTFDVVVYFYVEHR